MSDLARQYPAGQTPGGFAQDNRAEGARQYPPGQEKGTSKNADSSHDYKDDRTK